MDRAKIVEDNFRRRIAERMLPEGAAPKGDLTPEMALTIYRSQCLSRALDLESRAIATAAIPS